MTSEAERVLRITAEQLVTQVLPQLGPAYSQGSAAIMSLLLRFSAQELEHGADNRARENSEMRALFAALAPVVQDIGLREKLVLAAATRDESLLLSALDAANADLKRLMIAAHVHVEGTGASEPARRIWAALRTMAARRVVSL